MTSHEDWLRELRKPDRHGYVETRDDKTHRIGHIGNVPFRNNGKKTYLKNMLHVPTITKSLVSVNKIIEQGMQVRFNSEGCFIEKDNGLIAHGRQEGRMSILESKEVKSAMFAKSLKVETDLKLWHINLQKLQNMQSKGVIIRLLNSMER